MSIGLRLLPRAPSPGPRSANAAVCARGAALCALFAIALGTFPPLAHAGSLDYRARLQVAAELDTNAERKEGNERRTDGDLRLWGSGSLTWRPGEDHVVSARLDVGAKVFFQANDEDLFVTSGNLGYFYSPADWLSLGADAAVKDRRERSSATDYLQGGGGGSLRLRLASRLDLRLRAGYGRFTFRPDDTNFGYRGDDYSLELTAFLARRMRLAASYSFARRGYEALTFVPSPTVPMTVTTGSELRGDQVHTSELRWRFLRTVLFEAAYSFQWVRSNSVGFSYARHRVTAQVSTRLPWNLFAHLAGALQLLSFRDPIYVDPVLFIEDDNRNWVSAKLSRALGAGVSLELRYAFFASGLAGDPLYYRRHVASLGFAYSL